MGRGWTRKGGARSFVLSTQFPQTTLTRLNTSKMPPDYVRTLGLKSSCARNELGILHLLLNLSGPCASSSVTRCLSGFFQACPSMCPKLRRGGWALCLVTLSTHLHLSSFGIWTRYPASPPQFPGLENGPHDSPSPKVMKYLNALVEE